MGFTSSFETIGKEGLVPLAYAMKADNARFVQILATKTTDNSSLEVIYSFMKDSSLLNYKIAALQPGDSLPSISGVFLEAFVFENEIHDLFGIVVENIAIDFHGKFYDVATPFPMNTVCETPQEQITIHKVQTSKANSAVAQGGVE